MTRDAGPALDTAADECDLADEDALAVVFLVVVVIFLVVVVAVVVVAAI